MREINLLLNKASPETKKILLEETEDYLLLVLNRNPKSQSILYTLSNEAGYSDTVPSSNETFLRPKKQHYNCINFEGNFVKDNSVEVNMYLGFWSEILFQDLSLNLEILYQNAEPDKVVFRIGVPNMSNLLVKKSIEGHYEIIRTLITSQTTQQTTHEIILSTMTAAKDIEILYERIKSNISNKAFIGEQLAQIDVLRKNTLDFLINY